MCFNFNIRKHTVIILLKLRFQHTIERNFQLNFVFNMEKNYSDQIIKSGALFIVPQNQKSRYTMFPEDYLIVLVSFPCLSILNSISSESLFESTTREEALRQAARMRVQSRSAAHQFRGMVGVTLS